MSPTLIAAGVAAAISFSTGFYVAHRMGAASLAEYKLEEGQRLLHAAKVTERQRDEQQKASDELDRKQAARVADINRRLVDATDRLRDRVPRASGTPDCQSASAGATGAGLSREDGGFLAGEAARANTLREALGRCYGALDSQAAPEPVVPR